MDPEDRWDAICSTVYNSKYLRSNTNPCSEIKLNPTTTFAKETEMSNEKLYEINTINGKVYGHKLAVNSRGEWVMEIKGTGEVLSYNPKAIEEVLPHTIGIRFLHTTHKTTYHYLAPKDTFKVGSVYALENSKSISLVMVTEVDTKSTLASVEFKPLAKLVTE